MDNIPVYITKDWDGYMCMFFDHPKQSIEEIDENTDTVVYRWDSDNGYIEMGSNVRHDLNDISYNLNNNEIVEAQLVPDDNGDICIIADLNHTYCFWRCKPKYDPEDACYEIDWETRQSSYDMATIYDITKPAFKKFKYSLQFKTEDPSAITIF